MSQSSGTAAPQRDGFSIADLKSGFLVFLIALPLCLAISKASGFPPIAGVMTAIVGGMLVTLCGSSRLTIKGPAAGLIVIAIGAVTELGKIGMPEGLSVGEYAAAGYHRALAVGAVAAALQILFALLRMATLGIAMSPSVVHGMLAAIGVIIIAKQAQFVFGVDVQGSPIELLEQIPSDIVHSNWPVTLIGVTSLVILFGWQFVRTKWSKAIPPQLIVLAVAVPLGLYFGLSNEHDQMFLGSSWHLTPKLLVELPSNLAAAIQFPVWDVILSATSIKYIIMFALVGTIESTLTVIAVDSIDPEKRASDLNKDLLGLGVGNLVCALIGGLPMISEVVRSKANIDAGARTGWSNFTHGALLLLSIVLIPSALHMIPTAALAAMLIYTGTRLASPKEFHHAFHIGPDQLLFFVTTLVVTLFTDLLIGVGAGLALKILLHIARGAGLRTLFRTRIEQNRENGELRLTIHGTAAFTSLLAVRKILGSLDASVSRVVIDLSQVVIVDHTFMLRVNGMADELPNTTVDIIGTEDMVPASPHPHASRRRKVS